MPLLSQFQYEQKAELKSLKYQVTLSVVHVVLLD